MTEFLYLQDAYIREFRAEVVDQSDGGIVLNRTAFYPAGGGQPSDRGTLQTVDKGKSWVVEEVRKVRGDAIHFVSGDAPPVGTVIEGLIDWNRRYQLMRTHTAMHILCGVIWRDYQASVTGGDMQPLKGRMDFEFETMRQELVAEIEQAINVEVDAARPVRTNILAREVAFEIPDLIRTKINLLPEGIKEVRTVEIRGLDLQADGGTHVANTTEVGTIRVVDYKSKGRINKRIYVELSE